MTNFSSFKSVTFYLWFLLLSPLFLSAQDCTVGLVEYSEEVSDGYILFTPLSSESSYLIDNCGSKINEWGGLTPHNSNQAFMAEDGTLVRSSFNTFQKISWENEVLWSYEVSELGLLRHHDFHLMPNGNILFIASDVYSFVDIINKGRDPNNIGGAGGAQGFKVDGIYEIKPIGTDEAELVWSWNFFDHLVQDFDENQQNFDDVENQPRKLDVNFNGDAGNSADWLHCNGIDYHEGFDQIIISSRSTCELYIIDHSTTTEEAATSEGGIYGLGGDFLWRWGNPIAYDQGTSEDQKFWEQHDPKFINEGSNTGMITVFNNLYNYNFNGQLKFSYVHLLDINTSNGIYPTNADGTFEPLDFEDTYTGEVAGNNFMSRIMSSVQSMSNGNLFILQGETGEMFEINEGKEVVWVYQNPVREYIYDQGSDPLSLASAVDVFIATKYPSDFQGFDNYDMTPLGILENENTVSVICDSIVTNVVVPLENFFVYPNPASNNLTIESSIPNYTITLFDLIGRTLLSQNCFFDSAIDLGQFVSGVYFLGIESGNGPREYVKLVIE